MIAHALGGVVILAMCVSINHTNTVIAHGLTYLMGMYVHTTSMMFGSVRTLVMLQGHTSVTNEFT